MKKVENFGVDFAVKHPNFKFKSGYESPVFEIKSYHALIQFVGYAKYLNRSVGNVYLRGQHKLYSSVIPSIFRNANTEGGFSNRCNHIANFIKQCSSQMKFIEKLNEYTREPLLQHYGINTRWIDLVDNAWVAIWFGVHTWHTRTFDREYKNIIRRESGIDEYFYILLVCSDAVNEQLSFPGLYKGKKTFTIDLRKACPSIFLRPHSQHALLMRSKKLEQISDSDLSEYVVGIAKISVKDGLDWIGNNGLISARSLFPPVNFDHGYGVLIEQTPHNKLIIKDYGSIYTVTY